MSSQLCMTVRSGTSSTVSGFWTVVQQLKRSPSSSAVFPWSTSFSCTFLVSNSCTAPQRNVLGSLLRTPRAIQWWFSRRRRNQCTRTACFHFAVLLAPVTRFCILVVPRKSHIMGIFRRPVDNGGPSGKTISIVSLSVLGASLQTQCSK